MIQKLSNEEMQRFLESYGKKPKIAGVSGARGGMLDTAGGGSSSFAMSNTTNYYYNNTTRAGDSFFNHNEVFAGGGSTRENTAMEPA